ncbi:hypothetical protein FHW88_003384 [Mucilaginibacter sp. SG538B]|uniref:GmrSD restriction endonuclease domain-containing protein n=1 Tax=Mucilaginibacter sp. SG538B TaxID=2587021 RepID=UPI00159D789B|nr:DUF262 domain-containing protein [Mucilaginibacter sp. SG538B]NVM65080.1 hypothetical protein [Mucilaginibacter sp. SG538B]
MEIREIFENKIKIEPKVMSIESLFNNSERVAKTNYKPSYQRNYVWDDEKATYFIESILLGTEIPPLIYFKNAGYVEVIDGRQRYQTILRFIKNEFKLRKNGLQKLDNIDIANKTFKDLENHLQDAFWDTKLRLIEFSFHNQNQVDEEMEEVVKKEIFKRYNSGITPLKPTEIDNAVYFEDDLNSFLKNKLQSDQILYRDVTSLLHFEKSNTEIILKKIRQLLVQHKIPIKYYAVKKDTIISRYYEFLFSSIEDGDINLIFNSFVEKINLLTKIRNSFSNQTVNYNRLITECLFWAFSILEEEKVSLKLISNKVIEELVKYIQAHKEDFTMVRSSFAKILTNRYSVTAEFFSGHFGIDFTLYLQNSLEFKQRTKELTPTNEDRMSFDELRLNKPEPSSIAIMDICRQMERQRFLIRPPYQRNEVINKKKSSSIIESILLGIKLPPIFVYKREDGISEVLDGQQRLLSILGFIQKPYLDENNTMRNSDKDGFALNLKNSILSNLNNKKFIQLTPDDQEKIRNFDLWFIEINYRNNVNFEPIDLFIRLNNKPYPIKEDTFEMWNSYVSRNIVDSIKSIHKNHNDWFYLRKNSSRMEDENIYTALAYFQFNWNQKNRPENYFPKELDIYKVLNKIVLRVVSKNEITKVLESADLKDRFIESANELEFNFVRKLKNLISDYENAPIPELNANLDNIFLVENGRRTQQAFYALWYFLYDIPASIIETDKQAIREELRKLFAAMTETASKADFDSKVKRFKNKFKETGTRELAIRDDLATLGEISTIIAGTALHVSSKTNVAHRITIPYLKKGDFEHFQIKNSELISIPLDTLGKEREYIDSRPKILLKRLTLFKSQLKVAFVDNRMAFGVDTFAIHINRYGFLPKYVMAILGSRYIFSEYITARIGGTETKFISVADVKNVPIPAIPLSDQSNLEKIVNYIIDDFIDEQTLLFFERLLDGMVYELFLPEELAAADAYFMKYIQELPNIDSIDLSQRTQIIEDSYRHLSDPKHKISSSIIKMLSVSTIQRTEEFI